MLNNSIPRLCICIRHFPPHTHKPWHAFLFVFCSPPVFCPPVCCRGKHNSSVLTRRLRQVRVRPLSASILSGVEVRPHQQRSAFSVVPSGPRFLTCFLGSMRKSAVLAPCRNHVEPGEEIQNRNDQSRKCLREDRALGKGTRTHTHARTHARTHAHKRGCPRLVPPPPPRLPPLQVHFTATVKTRVLAVPGILRVWGVSGYPPGMGRVCF